MFAGEEMKQARSLAQQLSAGDASALVWGVGDVHQPLSEAIVSSYCHQQELAGPSLQGGPPEPLPEVDYCRCLPSKNALTIFFCDNLEQPCSQPFSEAVPAWRAYATSTTARMRERVDLI